ncbi:hypothetical protein GCM10022395_12820 [Snuella lapsa]|uniref:Uncharacterized protein n=1 Tax=Snuella lapsa TaxID=870481 RepID=A0ABP6XA83_9FLAO
MHLPTIFLLRAYFLGSTNDLQQDDADSHLILKSNKGETLLEYHRASKGLFTYDSKFLTFTAKYMTKNEIG